MVHLSLLFKPGDTVLKTYRKLLSSPRIENVKYEKKCEKKPIVMKLKSETRRTRRKYDSHVLPKRNCLPVSMDDALVRTFFFQFF